MSKWEDGVVCYALLTCVVRVQVPTRRSLQRFQHSSRPWLVASKWGIYHNNG